MSDNEDRLWIALARIERTAQQFIDGASKVPATARANRGERFSYEDGITTASRVFAEMARHALDSVDEEKKP